MTDGRERSDFVKLSLAREKLTVPYLIWKFPKFCGTRKLFVVFTAARHLSVPIQSQINSQTDRNKSEWQYKWALLSAPHCNCGAPWVKRELRVVAHTFPNVHEYSNEK